MTGASVGDLLSIRDLSVSFGARTSRPPVDGVSLDVQPGEVVGLVGSSGAGKSLTALSVLGLLPREARVRAGSIRLRGRELVGADAATFRSIRGRVVGLVLQDPQAALHPCIPVELQVVEGLAWEKGVTPAAERDRARAILGSVGLPDADLWGSRYPHQWSGGMRQRALLATALVREPDLLIVDEPTSALDVTLQAQLLERLRDLRDQRGTAILLITHDLGVVAELADRVAVMDAGRIVESGPAETLFDMPRHPATRFLVEGRRPPVRGGPAPGNRPPAGPSPAAGTVTSPARQPLVLDVRDLSVRIGDTLAVESVDLAIHAGEALGLVGESGCGKSTVARAIVGLEPEARGQVTLGGRGVLGASSGALRAARRTAQIVWQDPQGSLNPRRSVAWAVARPLRVHGIADSREARRHALELLERVGLPLEAAGRRPSDLSGGEQQRVAIARALAVQPRLLILDEPFSALDAALRSGLIDLLEGLRRELDLAYLLISHDLSLVRALVDRVAVAYLGRIVERGSAEAVLSRPLHPYTRALVAAAPVDHPRKRASGKRIVLEGQVPSAARRPVGCPFRTRCWKARPECAVARPNAAAGPEPGHEAACLFPEAPA